jgi:serine/threonine protein kinase
METVIRGYALRQLIISSEFYNVYKAEHAVLSGQTLRITLLNSEIANLPEVKSDFNSAAFRLSFAEHSYIIKNSDMVEENGMFAVLSEDLILSDLQSFLAVSDFEAKKVFIEKILEAIAYLNDRKIFHLSLTPSNIFVDNDGNPRIANYGFAEIMLKAKDLEIHHRVIASLEFLAPELKQQFSSISEKSEVYSCGRFIQTLLTEHSDTEVHPGINHIIAKCLESDINKRYRSVKELLTDFKDYENVLTKSIKSAYRVEATQQRHTLNADQMPRGEKPHFQQDQNKHQNQFNGTEKNVFTIFEEIKHQKNDNNENAHVTQQVFNQKSQTNFNQPTSNTSQSGQQQSNAQTTPDYNKTREAIRQNVSPQQNAPSTMVKTTNVIVLGVLSIIFGLMFSFVGFVLSIIGFTVANQNKKKVTAMGRQFTQNELSSQTIGIVICVIGLFVAIVKAIMFLGNTFA